MHKKLVGALHLKKCFIPKDRRKPEKALEAKQKILCSGESFQHYMEAKDGKPAYAVLPKELTVEVNIISDAQGFQPGLAVDVYDSVTVENRFKRRLLPEKILVFPSTGNYGIGGHG